MVKTMSQDTVIKFWTVKFKIFICHLTWPLTDYWDQTTGRHLPSTMPVQAMHFVPVALLHSTASFRGTGAQTQSFCQWGSEVRTNIFSSVQMMFSNHSSGNWAQNLQAKRRDCKPKDARCAITTESEVQLVSRLEATNLNTLCKNVNKLFAPDLSF